MTESPQNEPVDVFRTGARGAPVVAFDAVVAVFLGGAIGGLARYGLALLLPTSAGTWPWATFLTNVIGCLLIGVLMVFLLERGTPHRLLRPFLGVGILGGFTTFSTFAVETDRLLSSGHTATGLGYLVASVIVCLAAVYAGAGLARRLWLRDVVTAVDEGGR